jgi:hypothetical protein
MSRKEDESRKQAISLMLHEQEVNIILLQAI